MRRLIGWSFVILLVWGTLAGAQDAPVPTCEVQVETLYGDLLKERLIYEVPGGIWMQHLTALATQLRVAKDEAQMQAEIVKQRVSDIAIQKEINRQTSQQLTTTMQTLATAQARIKELETSQGQGAAAQK